MARAKRTTKPKGKTAPPDPLLRRLQETCQQYRSSLLVRQGATAEAMAAAWPGGAENADLTTWGWVKCYGSLRVMLGKRDPKVIDFDTEKRRRLVLDAMAETPESVELLSLDPATGERRVAFVHPKSDVACHEIHNRNLILARIIDDAEFLRASGGSAEDVALYMRASEEQSYLQRLISWIATTPGAGLPYPEQTRAPVLPPEVVDLSTLDYYLIAAAFQRVNVLRLAALHDSKTSAKRPDWPVFFASVAGELGGEMTAARLMRDRSLAAVLAEAAERARGAEEARARAEAGRKQGGSRPVDIGATMRTA